MLSLMLAAAVVAQAPACTPVRMTRGVELAHSGGFGPSCTHDSTALARICAPAGKLLRAHGVEIGRQSNVVAKPTTAYKTDNCVVSGVAGAPADAKGIFPVLVCGRAKAEAVAWAEYCR